MKIRKLLSVAVMAALCGNAWAQTDVTSTYLTNPSFELKAEGTAAIAEGLTNNGTYYGWQLPNLGTSFVNISIGNSTECAGQAFGIPTAKEGSAYYYCRRGWGNNSSPDATLSTSATLPAGSYTLTISYKGLDSYDSSHNTKGSYITISAVEGGTTLASSKTASFDAVNGNNAGAGKFTGDANWKEASVAFSVEEAGEVTLNIIHHLVGGVRTDVVIDDLQLLSVSALEKAQIEAKAALPAPAPALFGLTADQLSDYELQIDAATSVAEIEAIMDEVNNYEAPALSGSWAILNATNGLYLGAAVLSAESQATTFEKADGGFYIKVGDNYINMKGNNAWSMSADAEAKTAWTFALADGKYTIKGPNGLIGTDATTPGSAVYGDKKVANNGYWTIVDLAAAALESAKRQLEGIIEEMTIPTANIEGESTNVITWSKESVEAMKDAVKNATDVLDKSKSVDEVNGEIEKLLATIEVETINTIAEGSLYNIIMAKEGLDWTGNAVTFTYDEKSQNGYAMAYSAKAGESNYNQAVIFKKNYEAGYTMYIVDAEGTAWYLTDGAHVGSTVAWAGSQLRMTDVGDDAMPIDMLPSVDKEGVVEIINMWTGEHIGSTNNNGFYCSNDNYDLAIREAARFSLSVNTSAGYATVIIPAEVALPENAKIYTVESISADNVLTLIEETETVKANVPYIIETEQEAVTFAYIANAFKSEYTSGLLTGVYAETAAPKSSYVLQNQQEGLAFYVVNDEITVPANRAYLTAPSGSEAKAFFFGESATAISAIEALTSGKAEIYNLNGVKLNGLQKGINIVNGKKVMVK